MMFAKLPALVVVFRIGAIRSNDKSGSLADVFEEDDKCQAIIFANCFVATNTTQF